MKGFRVRGTKPDACGGFSWRVVAKRKDIVAARFAPVVIPVAPELPEPPPHQTPVEVPAHSGASVTRVSA